MRKNLTPQEMFLGTPRNYASLNLGPRHSRIWFNNRRNTHKPTGQNMGDLLQRDIRRVHCWGTLGNISIEKYSGAGIW